jgi:UDP-4-amino-4-deoxy-L-arabinose-oxoglutarate aminotransferase
MKVEFYRHNIGDDEKKRLLECLDGLFLTTGAYVEEFEEKFAAYLDLPYAIGLTSCTAALHLSMLALGIGKGDEVITTPMTFIATATAIMHTGAQPVFVDVEEKTGLIDPGNIEGAITAKTKAILPVHLYGQMCDMKRIREIADWHGLFIIEDCAHCIEGAREGVRPGHLGDIACFSFYATKSITSAEGGAMATKHKDVAEKIRVLRLHGMSKEAAKRYSGIYQHWDMIECGWKYNMDNIQAALLLPQLEKIDDAWRKRHALYAKYHQRLSSITGVEIPLIIPNSKSAFHLLTVWVKAEQRDLILEKLGNAGIGVAVNYRAIHLLTYMREVFGFQPGAFPLAEKIGARTISLPFWVNMSDEDINIVIESLKFAVNGYNVKKVP